MTIPDKPRSSKQKYRLTEKGRAVVVSLDERKTWAKQTTAIRKTCPKE
jgi:DNA-binding HxlR family transcriptional regulator